MSIASEITRINNNIANAYTQCSSKGATMPATQNSDNLANTISTISGGGGADLSDYFTTTWNTNTSSSNRLGDVLFKKIPKITLGSNVQSLSYAFDDMGIKVCVFEELDLANITDTSYMFYGNSFATLDISNFKNANNMTNMRSMFGSITWADGGNGLIGLNKIDTSKVTDMRNCFNYFRKLAVLDLSTWETPLVTRCQSMFAYSENLAIIDISKATFSNVTNFSSMFSSCGTQCLQSDGAYADGIPYIYVKDATEQNWVLTANNGHPSTWSTNNVVIKSS